MLDVAIKYQDELREKMLDTWFEDKYKYWNYCGDYSDFEVNTDTWNAHQFVSLDSDGNVIGYIGYEVNRRTNQCNGLSVINFSDNKLTFGKDLRQALEDIFDRFDFMKLNFTVIVGNPIEHTYDKMVEKYGGRIVGRREKHTKLIDGRYYDVKEYEIMQDKYLQTMLIRALKKEVV